MGNVLEFFVKMKDMMSSGLVKIAGTADKSFGKVQSLVDRVYNGMDRLKGKIGEVDRAASNSSFFNGSLLRKLAVGAAAMAAVGFVQGAVSKAMEFGATKMSYGVLTGDPKKGEDLANHLNKLQQDTILGPEVFENAKTMMGFGVGRKNGQTDIGEIEKDMRMLGDVSMGNAEHFKSLTLAFSQTTAAGRLMGQDLLQYINAGFNPLQVMSERWKEFGFTSAKSVGDLKKLSEQGQISSAMVTKAFELATGKGGMFYHMMDKIGETPFGKMRVMEGQFESMKIKLGEALMPMAIVVMQVRTKLMDIASLALPYITSGVQMIVDGFNAVLNPTSQWAFWVDYVKFLAGAIWDTVSYVAGIIWGIYKSVFMWASQSEIIKDAFRLVADFASIVWSLVKGIAGILGWIFDNIVMPVLNGIEAAYKWIKGILGLGGNEIKVTGTLTKAGELAGKSNATPAGIKPGKMGGNFEAQKQKDDVARGATSGGPRTINNYIGKFFDNIVIHASNTDEALGNVETRVQEMFLRILNSGAAVQ